MINVCKVCNNQFEAERATKVTCSDACRQKLSRVGVTVTEVVPIVTKNPIVTGADLTVTEVTPDIERKLVEAYKAFEKKYSGRKRGPTGNLSIPDIKCTPRFIEGKRVLTEWEKAVLDGRMVYGDEEEIYIEEKVEDHKVLKFSHEKLQERIAAYRKEYEGVTYIPNWILHGFNSKDEALKEAMKAVRKSVGDSNSGL
jgi:hypothetical protein